MGNLLIKEYLIALILDPNCNIQMGGTNKIRAVGKQFKRLKKSYFIQFQTSISNTPTLLLCQFQLHLHN